MLQAGVIVSDYATLMVEILEDNARPEAGEVYGAMDLPWATLVGQMPTPTEGKWPAEKPFAKRLLFVSKESAHRAQGLLLDRSLTRANRVPLWVR